MTRPAHDDDLVRVIKDTPWLMDALRTARTLDLPDWRIVAGAIYGTVWNHLTGRTSRTGLKDIAT